MALLFIHQGYSSYLEFTLRQAHAASPESEIVLLGDADNDRFPFVTHVDIGRDDYVAAGDEIARVYRHMATNPHAVALRWLQRWFWLRTYVRESGVTNAWVLDSDVLLFASEAELTARYVEEAEAPLALAIPEPEEPYVWAAGPHASYWTRQTVEDFCMFALASYTEPDRIAAYEAKWAHHRREAIDGGVCDMTTLYLFAQETPHMNVLEAREGTVFDHNLNVPDNRQPDEFEMDGHIKRLGWDEMQRPFGIRQGLGDRVRFLGLHLQGQAKRYCGDLYRGPKFEGQARLSATLRQAYTARAFAGKLKRVIQRGAHTILNRGQSDTSG